MFDYYKILGITENADEREIKIAFRNKLKEYHPDKLENKDVVQIELEKTKFYLVKEAGETLINPQTKREYDQSRRKKELTNDYKKEFQEYIQRMELNDFEEEKKKLPESEKIIKDPVEKSLRKYEDILIQREQNDIENSQTNIFKDRQFDQQIFNNVFEKLKKRYEENMIVNYETMEGMEGINRDNFAEIDNKIEKIESTECSLSESSAQSQKPLPPINEAYMKYMNDRKQNDELLKNPEFVKPTEQMPQISRDFGHMIGNNMGGCERENSIYRQIIMNAYNSITGLIL